MVLRVAVDFDGVLNTYTGWAGEDCLFEPRPGVWQFLSSLDKKYDVVVFTARDVPRVWDWLVRYNLAVYVVDVTNVKPRAFIYIDDRGYKFEGDFDEVLRVVGCFTTHWEHDVTDLVDGDL